MGLLRMGARDEWESSLTQEWPLGGHLHQISYSIPYEATRGGRGLGDVMINYRLQVTEDAPGTPAFSPRISLIVPGHEDGVGWPFRAAVPGGRNFAASPEPAVPPVPIDLYPRLRTSGWSHLNDALTAVKRLVKTLKEPFHLPGRDLSVTASIGVALSADEYVDADELLRHSDVAMYRAKKLGKDRYEVFDRATSVRLERQSQIESDLGHAVERDELVLEYQPIVTLQTGKIAGFEALLRWQHPTLGLIPPPDFISVAEATGAIVPIGEWVLQEGCRQIREWQKSCPQVPPLYVSINLSVKQLAQPDLVEQVAVAMHNVGLDPAIGPQR